MNAYRRIHGNQQQNVMNGTTIANQRSRAFYLAEIAIIIADKYDNSCCCTRYQSTQMRSPVDVVRLREHDLRTHTKPSSEQPKQKLQQPAFCRGGLTVMTIAEATTMNWQFRSPRCSFGYLFHLTSRKTTQA